MGISDSLEEVDFDGGFRFKLLDSSHPLLIDISARPIVSTYLKMIGFMLALVVLVSSIVPSNSYTETIFYETNGATTAVYLFNFTRYPKNVRSASLSVTLIGDTCLLDEPGDLQMSAIVYDLVSFNSTIVKTFSQQYKHRKHQSDEIVLFRVQLTGRYCIGVNMTLHLPKGIDGLNFEWRSDNPANQSIQKVVFYSLLPMSLFLALLLVINLNNRLEQIGTLMLIIVYVIASTNLLRSTAFGFLFENVMVIYLRIYLFYMISFISNKHKHWISTIIRLIIIISFGFETIYSLRQTGVILAQMVTCHMALAVGVVSVTAAMYFFADERYAFLVYSLMFALSTIACIVCNDYVVIHGMHPWFEPKVCFYGIHMIILMILSYFHQGVVSLRSERDHISAGKGPETDTNLFI